MVHDEKFLTSDLQPEEQLFTTSPAIYLQSLQGNLALIDPDHPIPFHTAISTMSLPRPLTLFFQNPDINLTQFLALQPNTPIFPAKSFLSFLNLDPVLLLGGCYGSFRTPSHRHLILTYREAFILYLWGFPDFPAPQFQHNDNDLSDFDSVTTSSSSSSISSSSNSFNSTDDLIDIVKLL
jgi:hypothetical protein